MMEEADINPNLFRTEKPEQDLSVMQEATTTDATAETSYAILLAEDDAALRRYLEVSLQRAGARVTAVADGIEAMKAALEGKFDVIVTDAVMPGLDGHELCRFLKQHPQLAHIPLILLSGLETSDGVESDCVADISLTKPVAPQTLLDHIALLVKRD